MIKRGNPARKNVDPAIRVQLIRKGNEFFSNKNIKSAEAIFVKVDYKDGLVRLGDYYLDNGNIYKAAQMFFMSENKSKIDAFSKRCARIISDMIKEQNDDVVYEKILIDSGDNNDGK